MTTRVKQKTWDDCTIAAVAMVTGLKYKIVHNAAKKSNYVRGSGVGISIGDVICNLNWDMEWKPGLIVQETAILVVASLNFENTLHAVVLKNGEILDPSNGEHVTYEHCEKTCKYTYYDFKPEPPHWIN